MAFRVVTNRELEQIIPTEQETRSIEQRILNPKISQSSLAKQFLSANLRKKPAPQPAVAPRVITVVPEPVVIPEPVMVEPVMAEPVVVAAPVIPEKVMPVVRTTPKRVAPVKSSFDLPLGPDGIFLKRKIAQPIPEPIPLILPDIELPDIEPLFEPDPVHIPVEIPVAVRTVPAYSEYPDSAGIYGSKPAQPRAFNAPKASLPSVHLPRFHMPNLHPKITWLLAIFFIVRLGFAAAMIYFGISTTGSYFTPASRFGDDLFLLFYRYQFGSVVMMAGAILAYDTIRFRNKKY